MDGFGHAGVPETPSKPGLMRAALIIGSGPTAAGAALALSRNAGIKITVLDVGECLEADKQALVDHLSGTALQAWPPSIIDAISAQPIVPTIDGHPRKPTDALPQKRTYGSDFPFRDVGQLTGVTAQGRANGAVISGAYGGFSNVWGAQIMPFTSASFDTWPVNWSEMAPHYRSVLSHIPFAAEGDDLAALFPLLAERVPSAHPRTEVSHGARCVHTKPHRVGASGDHDRTGPPGVRLTSLCSVRYVHDRLSVFAHLLGVPDFRRSAPAGSCGLPRRCGRLPSR